MLCIQGIHCIAKGEILNDLNEDKGLLLNNEESEGDQIHMTCKLLDTNLFVFEKNFSRLSNLVKNKKNQMA